MGCENQIIIQHNHKTDTILSIYGKEKKTSGEESKKDFGGNRDENVEEDKRSGMKGKRLK